MAFDYVEQTGASEPGTRQQVAFAYLEILKRQSPSSSRPESTSIHLGTGFSATGKNLRVEVCLGGRLQREYHYLPNLPEDPFLPYFFTSGNDNLLGWEKGKESKPGETFNYYWKPFPPEVKAAELLAETIGCQVGELKWSEFSQEEALRILYRNQIIAVADQYRTYLFISSFDFKDALRPLPAQIGWRNSRYRYPEKAAKECVEKGLAKEYFRMGQSGISSRNSITLGGYNTVELTVPIIRISHVGLDSNLEPKPEITFSSYPIQESTKVVLPNPETYLACHQILSDCRRAEAMGEMSSLFVEGSNVVEVRQFNDLLASSLTPAEFPEVFMVNSYVTTLGNSTVVLLKLPEVPQKGQREIVLKCPDDLRGVVIGKGGNRARELSSNIAKRFKLEHPPYLRIIKSK